MENKKLRIGYFADGPWAHNAFNLVIADDSIEIAFICVRYDSEDRFLRENADRYGIPLLKYPNINTDEFYEIVNAFNCRLFVSMSFNQIFKSRLAQLPFQGTINCHAGKLPFYRGRNILNWVLINGDMEYGITVHYIDEGIDTGDIILQRTYPISDADDYRSLLEQSHSECAKLLYEAILLVRDDRVKAIRQTDIHPVGFYCCKREAGDEVINWDQSSRDVFNFIRAVTHPGPMARTFCRDGEVKINRAVLIPDAPVYKGNPGQVVGKTGNGFIVKTQDSTLTIVDYQYSGKIRIGDRLYINAK